MSDPVTIIVRVPLEDDWRSATREQAVVETSIKMHDRFRYFARCEFVDWNFTPGVDQSIDIEFKVSGWE